MQEVRDMANEEKKDFNAMLHKDTDMPRIQMVTDQATIKKYGGEKMFFAPPVTYDEIMKKVPRGKSHYCRRHQRISGRREWR